MGLATGPRAVRARPAPTRVPRLAGSSVHGPGRRPAHVLLHYAWEESVERNTRLATRVLYLAGAALLVLSTVVVASDVTVPLVSGGAERAKAA